MNFFKTIFASIYSPQFYQTIPQKTLWAALRYFLLLVFLLTVVQTIISAGPISSSFKNAVKNLVYSLVDLYPQELIITIKDGKVSTNVEEPYFIPLLGTASEFWQAQGEEAETLENLLVIDTKTPYSSAQMNEYSTVALLTKDALFVREDQGEINVFDLSKISGFTLDRALIDSFVAKAAPYLEYLGPIVTGSVFLMTYSSYSWRVVYALFFGVAVLILSSTWKLGWNYRQAYNMSLYAMTAGVIVEFIVGITSPIYQFGGFPFLFSLITVGVVFVNIRTMRFQRSKP